MNNEEKTLYKLNDSLFFRICTFDDCTEKDRHWAEHIKKCDPTKVLLGGCMHTGQVHLHCGAHRECELALRRGPMGPRDNDLLCPICETDISSEPEPTLLRLTVYEIDNLKQQAWSLLNSSQFKNAKLVRLDDYYYPELSEKNTAQKDSRYWMSYDVKRNKNGQPILILYLGDRDLKNKAQFFIEPESQKLSHDHKDTSPMQVISRIEVQFTEGTIELKNKAQK